MKTRTLAAAGAGVASAVLAAVLFAQEAAPYVATRKIDHMDDYHGTKVADPYRWLEDETSPETAAWIEAQNAVTFPYLERIPYRDALRARVMELNDYERYGAPARKGPYFFFSKNEGLQNQSVLYIQQGLDGAPNVLLDPNSWSADGTVQLSAFEPSKDAKYAVYGISQSGSDWQQYRVLELAAKRTLADTVDWAKVSSVAWHGDGFYYSRYPEPPEGHEKASINENHQVFFHELGTPQSADTLIFEDPANPQRFHTTTTTEDERVGRLRRAELVEEDLMVLVDRSFLVAFGRLRVAAVVEAVAVPRDLRNLRPIDRVCERALRRELHDFVLQPIGAALRDAVDGVLRVLRRLEGRELHGTVG